MATYIKILKVCNIWSISSISRYLSSVHTDSCAKCCMYHDTALLVLKEWACSADSLIDKEWWHRICLQCRRPGSVSEGEDPLEKRRGWQPTPRFLPGESYRRRSPEGYSPRVHKSETRLSDQHFYHDMHWSIFTTMMIRNNPRL